MKKSKSPATPQKPWIPTKFIHILFLLVLSLLFFANYNRIFDEKIDMNGDNIQYYALGKALVEGKGYTNIISFNESPHTHFPPGYPVFVAFVMKFTPDSIHAVKVANGVLLYLSMLLLFYVLRIFSGSALIAFLASLFAVLQTTVLRFATIMMSEMLFIFFTLIVLLIILKWDPSKVFSVKKKRWKDILYLTLMLACLAYIYFIRTMGLSFILAVIIYYSIGLITRFVRYIKNRKQLSENAVILKEAKNAWMKYGIVLVLVICSFLIPKTLWDVRNKSIGHVQSNYIENFHRKQGGEVMQTFSDWQERVLKNTATYITQWIPSAAFSYTVDVTNEHKESSVTDWAKGLLILLLILFGLYKLPKGSLFLFFYLGITMGVLLIWPEQYGGQRYMIPIIPFIIFLLIFGINASLQWLLKKWYSQKAGKLLKISPFAACILFTLLAYPTYAASIKAMADLSKFKDYTTTNATPPLAEFLDAIRWFKTNVQDTGRVSTRKPELFYIYSGGRKSTSFPYYATPEEIIDYLTNNHIRYVIIDRWFRHAYVTVMPAVQKYQDKFRMIHQIGGTEPNTPPTYVLEFNPDWGYKGGMLDGKRHGQGRYVMQDGRTYTGAFANDMCNGYGIMTDAQGNVLAKGIWKDNTLIKPE